MVTPNGERPLTDHQKNLLARLYERFDNGRQEGFIEQWEADVYNGRVFQSLVRRGLIVPVGGGRYRLVKTDYPRCAICGRRREVEVHVPWPEYMLEPR